MLFVTLDSCRYDTFADLKPHNLMQVGPLHRAKAPGTFTYASHSAMFVGFTPGDFEASEPYVNPMHARIFRMGGGRAGGSQAPWVFLTGRNIIDGFRVLGYRAVGTGAVGWFNPATPTAQVLISDFDEFFYAGDPPSVRRQVDFIWHHLADVEGHLPVFAFMNIGETHAPYSFEGAPWPRERSLARVEANHDAADLRRRQTACLDYVDRELGPLLGVFQDANVLVCADHGDAWGEQGFWGHGFHHEKVIDVPLLMRLQTPPVSAEVRNR